MDGLLINFFIFICLTDSPAGIFTSSKFIAMQTSELVNNYHVENSTWDEMYKDASVRDQYKGVVDFMQQLSIDELNKKEELARGLFMSQGITFTVYSSGEGIEKIFLSSRML